MTDRELSDFALGGGNPREWLSKLRERAEARVDVVAQAAEAEADALAAQLERRRARLKAAGFLDPDAAQEMAEATARCPRVEGHPGSMAAAAAMDAFVNAPHVRLAVLAGPTGRGKSWAATWPIAQLPTASAWVSAAECRVAGWDDVRAKAAAVKLLVVDDMGREATDWAARELGDLVELRFNRGQRTIITTNLTRPLFVSRYGDRLESRMEDTGLSRWTETAGPDLRRRRN